MSVLQRMVLLIKVLVLLTVGTSAAWANAGPVADSGLWSMKSPPGSALMLAKSLANGQGQDGNNGEDGSNGDDAADGGNGQDGGNGADGSGPDDPDSDDDNDS